MEAVTESGAQHPLSLRFVDGDLERRCQRAAGAESIGGCRVIAGSVMPIHAVTGPRPSAVS